jgi:hypothetical protein
MVGMLQMGGAYCVRHRREHIPCSCLLLLRCTAPVAYSGGLAGARGHGATGGERGLDTIWASPCLSASMLGGRLSHPPRLARPSGGCMGFGAGCHWTGVCDKVQVFDGSSGVLARLVGGVVAHVCAVICVKSQRKWS